MTFANLDRELSCAKAGSGCAGGFALARRQRMARETMDIYAPLAHRLGMWQVKWELEDLAFSYLHPESYDDIVQRIRRKRKERETFVAEVREILERELERVDIHADISGRPKHVYSIWKKMEESAKTFDEIYDLIAIRVAVDSIKDCYGVLGVVHSLWKPVPGRFKDYIAMPKSNGYQSLHNHRVALRRADGDPDPHPRDARDGGVRGGRALALQGGRQGGRRRR